MGYSNLSPRLMPVLEKNVKRGYALSSLALDMTTCFINRMSGFFTTTTHKEHEVHSYYPLTNSGSAQHNSLQS
jgi:hypothetical protein